MTIDAYGTTRVCFLILSNIGVMMDIRGVLIRFSGLFYHPLQCVQSGLNYLCLWHRLYGRVVFFNPLPVLMTSVGLSEEMIVPPSENRRMRLPRLVRQKSPLFPTRQLHARSLDR